MLADKALTPRSNQGIHCETSCSTLARASLLMSGAEGDGAGEKAAAALK